MNHFEKDEITHLSEIHSQRSDEPEDSNDQRNISRIQSASISIPMDSLDPYDRQPNLVGHTGPLRTARETPVSQMSGPLYATPAIGNPFQNSITVAGNKVGENKTEKFSTFDGTHNEHLLRSGQLGMCNDPYCTTCPTYFEVAQQRKPRASKFHNFLYGDAKGFGRKLLSFCSSCIPRVINPHTKVVHQWNKVLAISCSVAIFVDPAFAFLFYVNKDDKCIVINWTMAIPLVLLRSIMDVLYFFNIFLQFRLASINPESRLVDVPRRIALNYLKNYFLIDLFVASPLPQIMLPNSLGSSGANNAKNLLYLVIVAQFLLRLFRFLPQLIGKSPIRSIFVSAWANLIIGLLMFHVVGSCWYVFGLQRVNQCLRDACHHSNIVGCMDLIDCDPKVRSISATLWSEDKGADACLNATSAAFSYGIYANAIPLTIETKVINKYVYALFWGFQQVITLAGNQTPSYFVWEVLFTMSIMALGLLLLVLLIGNIQGFFQSLGKSSLEMMRRGRDVEQWMSHCRLPEDLKKRVRQAEQYSWVATRGVPEKMVPESLPEDLQTDIRRHLFKFVKKVRIFSHLNEDVPVLDAIRERLIHTRYMKGSRILSQGGLVQKMVFIVSGKLESIGEDGIPVLLSEGDACGEELLRWYLEQSSEGKGKKVKLQGQGLTSDRTVRCLTYVEACSLHAEDIEELTNRFARFLRSPHVQANIRYESPYWRSLAATKIQAAWRNRKQRLSQANNQTLRYEWPHGKSFRGNNRIQVAWRNRKKYLKRANTKQNV